MHKEAHEFREWKISPWGGILTILKQAILPSPQKFRLSTIKTQCFLIRSCLAMGNRKLMMQLSAEGRRVHFLEHVVQNFEIVRLDYKFIGGKLLV